MNRSRWAVLPGIVLLVVLGSALGPAGAQERSPSAGGGSEPGGFSVQPSGPDGPGGRDYFIYDLEPGETFGDTVGVSNFGTEPATFFLYATDAYTTEGEGAFTLLREEEEPADVGTWIELGADQYTVNPGERVDIPFRVTVPEDASPGDHAGAIVAQRSNESVPDDGTFNVDFRLRVGARMYVRVAGPIDADLRVEDLGFRFEQPLNPLAGGEARINFVARNAGNIRLAPRATVTIKGPFGITLKTLESVQLPELLPGSELEIAQTASGIPQVGRITAEVELETGEATTTVTKSRWAVPWLLVAAAGVAGAAWFVARRSRRSGDPDVPPPPSGQAREKELAGV